MNKTILSVNDIMPLSEYTKVRPERKKSMTEYKKNRRVAVGPDATVYFESYQTMLHQIHEMLYIEKGGEAQIPDELAAYAPLVPGGRELVATLMIEINDPDRRSKLLAGLGGFEETVSISFDGEIIMAIAEQDIDRTTAEGKASSIQFLHFPFTDQQVEKFRAPGQKITLGIGHELYPHMTIVPETIRIALSADFS